ncbi:MAG TPA: glycosyltransferase [Saprospiraceae bacterium]|nr:glycosyltransferase [Saprospiraceae bacterium]
MAKIICTATNDLTYDQRMIRICSSLAKAGFEVLLIGREKHDSIPLQKRPFQQIRLRCRYNQGKLFYLEYNIRLLLHLSRAKYDLLCAVDLDTLAPAFFWSRLRKKPMVYDAHEYFTEVPEVVNRPLVKAVWSALARFVIPRLEFAYTVGPQLARIFTERYGTDFTVIRNLPSQQKNAITSAASLPKRETNDFILLYQGALNQGRGIETVIEALSLLPHSVQLWLVGEGDLSIFLRKLTKEKRLQDRVHFLGYRQPEELKTITPQADLGLNLLENKGLSYYYSLANKCFDYIQAELPAIHMDFPEYRALQAEHPAFVLLPDLAPAPLAHLIMELSRDNQKYAALQAACGVAAEALTWEKEERKLLAFYEEVLG